MMHDIMDKADRLIKRHPFIVVLFCLLLVVVPGYYRLQVLVDDVEETAATNQALIIRLDEDQAARLVDRCRDVNTAQAATRESFFDVFDVIAELVTNPQDVIPALEAAVPLPEDQDLDCNGNGDLDSGDYSRR